MESSKQTNFDNHTCYQEYLKRVDASFGRVTTSAKEDTWIEDLSAGILRLIQTRKHSSFKDSTPNGCLDGEDATIREGKQVKLHQPKHRDIPPALLARLRADNIITRLRQMQEEIEPTTEQREEEEEVPHSIAKSAYIDCAMERLVPGYQSLRRQQQESLVREDMRTSLDPILGIADSARELKERGMPVAKVPSTSPSSPEEETFPGLGSNSPNLLAHRQLARSIRTRHVARSSLGRAHLTSTSHNLATTHSCTVTCTNLEEEEEIPQNFIQGTQTPPPSPAGNSTPPPTPQSPTSSTEIVTRVAYMQRPWRGVAMDRKMSCQRTSSSREKAELSRIGAPTERATVVLTAKRRSTEELPREGDEAKVWANASDIICQHKQKQAAEARDGSEVSGSEGVKVVGRDWEGGSADGMKKVRETVSKGCDACEVFVQRVQCESYGASGRVEKGLEGAEAGKSPCELGESVEDFGDSFGLERGQICFGCELVGSEQHEERILREGSEIEEYVAHVGCELCMASCYFLDRVRLDEEERVDRGGGCAESSCGVDWGMGKATSVPQREECLKRGSLPRGSFDFTHGWREVLVESSRALRQVAAVVLSKG